MILIDDELYFSIDEAIESTGLSRRTIRQNCQAGKYEGAIRQQGEWLIPVGTLWAHTCKREARLLDEAIEAIPASKRGNVLARMELIRKWSGFKEKAKSIPNMSRREAMLWFVSKYGQDAGQLGRELKPSTFYRWIRNYRKLGPRGLIDNRGGDLRSHKATEHAKKVFEYYSQRVRSLGRKRLPLEEANRQAAIQTLKRFPVCLRTLYRWQQRYSGWDFLPLIDIKQAQTNSLDH